MAENILGSMSAAIICVDHELKLRFINQSAEALLEVSGTRCCGRTISEFLLNTGELESVIYDALQTGQPYTRRRAQLDLPTGNTITVDYAITPISENEWPQLLVELYPLDRYLRIDRDEVLRDHQEITRQMIRGLAHEIKNPLGGIRGSAQLLARELDDPSQREYTDIIIGETDRLTALVDRLLGPRNAPKRVSTNIHELLERVCRLIELEADGKVKIKRDYDPSIPEINIDKELMLQAFLNVARNAMQCLGETPDACICIVTRTERQFTIGAKRYRTVVTVDIIDNGPGIPDTLKDHLFYPMISGRPDGTGLGLSLAQSIIHRHEGLIEVESEPGKTDFTIIIPLEQPQ
ncbi:MAG: PAS domain-containing protein [Pseudomonadales bacterium]|nr:PAS domain-containing protein [Pseudomonadales bacterium]